jgi:ubiquinone/menaquinone biosynthesis C-methylase UbiE
MAKRSDVGGLSPEEARQVYNRIGRVQDWQGFYERAPIIDLIEHAAFESATAVFELGCGTGALAQRLLASYLDPAATYQAVDISDTMVRLASARLAPWADRCQANQVDGSLPLPGKDHTFDRFVAAYVFDLLDDGYTDRILEEAQRLLVPGGKLCTVGLTHASTTASRIVHRVWEGVWKRAPRLVGGCRPVALAPLLTDGWEIDHHRVVTSWGITSEVIIATTGRAT